MSTTPAAVRRTPRNRANRREYAVGSCAVEPLAEASLRITPGQNDNTAHHLRGTSARSLRWRVEPRTPKPSDEVNGYRIALSTPRGSAIVRVGNKEPDEATVRLVQAVGPKRGRWRATGFVSRALQSRCVGREPCKIPAGL